MCGIYGALGKGAIGMGEVHETLSRVLCHRGPDDEGFREGEGWAVGFRRLSILDLTPAGNQPMASDDSRHWIVFNGEIYNYIELRRELEQKGESFNSCSDTEVLLRLLMREGVAALQRLNGMFAFVYLNTQTRQFIMARDRLGVKPLYYCCSDGELRFASELKALLSWPDAKRNINTHALAEYLAVNYLPSELCIFEGYRKLSQGMYLEGCIDCPEQAMPVSYWSVELNDELGRSEISNEELEDLDELLTDATRIRLHSDVPVGVFLSGGIDSGLIAALAAKSSSSSQRPLALTVAFAEEEYNEAALAQATAEHAGLPHEIIQQSPGSLHSIDEIAWYYDEPFGDASALPTFMLCKAAAKHATVFLSGDGGDEVFGGYRRYIEARRYKNVAGMVRPFRSLVGSAAGLLPSFSRLRYKLLKASLPDRGYAATFDGITNDPVLAMIAGPALIGGLGSAGGSIRKRWNGTRKAHLLSRQQQLDFSHYLPDDILVKVDRASMAHSVEVRSPFLDYRVVEWAGRLPRSVMLNGTQGKLPLRALASRLLPSNVQQAGKRGFGVPLDDWFRQAAGRAFVQERLVSPRAENRGWWNPETIRTMLDMQGRESGRRFGSWFWRLLMLDAWARHYVDNRSFLGGPQAGVSSA